jgi:hypothetical protein
MLQLLLLLLLLQHAAWRAEHGEHGGGRRAGECTLHACVRSY